MTTLTCEMCGGLVRAAVLHKRRTVHVCKRCLPVVLVGRKVREAVTAKARRLRLAGRVHVVRHTERLVVVHVTGDTGTYVVSLVSGNPPTCSCPAGSARVRCSHALAAQAVARTDPSRRGPSRLGDRVGHDARSDLHPARMDACGGSRRVPGGAPLPQGDVTCRTSPCGTTPTRNHERTIA